jgi:hypothetical protein
MESRGNGVGVHRLSPGFVGDPPFFSPRQRVRQDRPAHRKRVEPRAFFVLVLNCPAMFPTVAPIVRQESRPPQFHRECPRRPPDGPLFRFGMLKP